MAVTVTFHGHATFSLDVNGTKLIVDPFLKGNNPLAKTSADEISDIDYVLITHGHSDHVIDAASIAKRCDATIIATFEIADWFARQGVRKTHPQHLGGGFHHPFGYLKMTPALHGSKLPDGEYGGMPAGFLLKTGEQNIYIAGDTGLFSDMSLIGEHGIDLAILPIGDNVTMGPDDALRAVQFLNPKKVVPCHFDTFGFIRQDAAAWVARVDEETSAEGILMAIDSSITL
ncbi:MAG: metal-dependent hydrolase [Candidatus Promineifilaceae bacterium]